jgi:hypothetical protein
MKFLILFLSPSIVACSEKDNKKSPSNASAKVAYNMTIIKFLLTVIFVVLNPIFLIAEQESQSPTNKSESIMNSDKLNELIIFDLLDTLPNHPGEFSEDDWKSALALRNKKISLYFFVSTSDKMNILPNPSKRTMRSLISVHESGLDSNTVEYILYMAHLLATVSTKLKFDREGLIQLDEDTRKNLKTLAFKLLVRVYGVGAHHIDNKEQSRQAMISHLKQGLFAGSVAVGMFLGWDVNVLSPQSTEIIASEVVQLFLGVHSLMELGVAANNSDRSRKNEFPYVPTSRSAKKAHQATFAKLIDIFWSEFAEQVKYHPLNDSFEKSSAVESYMHFKYYLNGEYRDSNYMLKELFKLLEGIDPDNSLTKNQCESLLNRVK